LYVVRAADVENLKLIVTRDISVATATTVSVDLAVLEEVALDGYLRVISGCRSDVLPLRVARPPGRVVKVCRRFDLAIAVEIVIVYQIGIRSIQSMGRHVVVRVIGVLNLDYRVDPSVSIIGRIVSGDE
jgi:hypothetical protein